MAADKTFSYLLVWLSPTMWTLLALSAENQLLLIRGEPVAKVESMFFSRNTVKNRIEMSVEITD